MSDAAVPAVDIPAVSIPRPRRGFWAQTGFLIRAGWRPASGWVCVGVLAVNGVILPLARVHGATLEPIDWHGLTPFAALLIGQAVLRTVEKSLGASD